jgi:hypothetical protein
MSEIPVVAPPSEPSPRSLEIERAAYAALGELAADEIYSCVFEEVSFWRWEGMRGGRLAWDCESAGRSNRGRSAAYWGTSSPSIDSSGTSWLFLS